MENFGLAGRVEYKLFGDWKNYKDFTARGTETDLLVLGAATDWTQGEDTDVLFGTIDAQWESRGGLGFYAVLLSNYSEITGSGGGSRFEWGGVQGSYLFTKQVEGFARYDFTKFDGERGRRRVQRDYGRRELLPRRGRAPRAPGEVHIRPNLPS